ncbi:MAG: hypothetical protein JOZ69_02475 [Myxococcales bacterium]|nr:hypothetical protein [Myxococcales bacterium]
MLFAFASTGETVGWQQNTNSGGPSATVGWTAADGHACAGALGLTVGFHAYDGVSGSAIYTPAVGSSWMGTKRLHAWVKLAPLADAGPLDYAALGSLEVSVTSNGWANYSFIAQEVNPAFSDGGWHEVVLEFKASSGGQPGRIGPDVVPSSVQRIGVLLSSATSRPPGSAAVPPAVLLLLDDVWVE